jgi:MarR family transcriptional regulator, negative regulator of the multidrug operon emrRAB
MPSPRIANLLGALVLSLGDEIARAAQEHLGIQGEAAAALVSIGNSPGRSIGWLSRTLILSHSGTVRLLDKLDSHGWVVRARLESDAREASLQLTSAGRLKMAAVLRSRRDCLDRALAALSSREQQLLRGLAEKMLAAVAKDEQGDAMCRLCEESACPQSKCPVTLACRRDAGLRHGS